MKMIKLEINDTINFDLNITINAVENKLNIDLDELTDNIIKFTKKFVLENYIIKNENNT